MALADYLCLDLSPAAKSATPPAERGPVGGASGRPPEALPDDPAGGDAGDNFLGCHWLHFFSTITLLYHALKNLPTCEKIQYFGS